jgi:hypothetical protein
MAAKNSMARVAQVYGMVERMRSVERRVAANAVDEVVCSEAIQTTVLTSLLGGARDALAAGNREEQQIAETARQRVELGLERLAQMRVERQAVLERVAAEHRESVVAMEQIDRLLERARAAESLEADRREQAVADDRFGSRLAWRRMMRVSISD